MMMVMMMMTMMMIMIMFAITTSDHKMSTVATQRSKTPFLAGRTVQPGERHGGF
jgi:hypothetical protein